jgi:heavy metal translocating P-type ATPase
MPLAADPAGWAEAFRGHKSHIIAALAIAGLTIHLLLRFALRTGSAVFEIPLLVALLAGGAALIFELAQKVARREFGSDLLAGISIVTSILLGEYLAGTIVVLMLSGGEVLENFGVQSASAVLRALAKRIPSIAHRKHGSVLTDISVGEIKPGDVLTIFPHEICPVDGTVSEGQGRMDESYLTGEPFHTSKAPGAEVISGAINGDSALTITATKFALDSRFAKITQVMRDSEKTRPRLRRLGDQLGAYYTPVAVAIALLAWLASGDAVRFLAVLVVATPCPLLIAIPVAVIGSISLSARRGIIIKNPAVLEQADRCRTIIFDKTGTLTYGEPVLTEQLVTRNFDPDALLGLTASLEAYSKHPLARAVLAEARRRGAHVHAVEKINEPPGRGLEGIIAGRQIQITGRTRLISQGIGGKENLPATAGGLECCVAVDGQYAATYRFRDAPRPEGVSFVRHLGPKHQVDRIMIVSGDRESEVRYLAGEVGIDEIHSEKKPEEKLAIVRTETARAKTLYVGDGINDAPAMMAATVGVAIGSHTDVTAEAAGAVIMEGDLRKVDEFMHVGRRMRSIALQSAVGGMALSVGGMGLAAMGLMTPVAGALAQEIIDVLSILNALRAALPPKNISDI